MRQGHIGAAMAIAMLGVTLPIEAADTLVEINTSTIDGSKYFLDPTTVKLRGAYAMAWILENYPASRTDIAGHEYASENVLWAVNCETQQAAFAADIVYSGPMGNGTPIQHEEKEQAQWYFMSAPPQSTGASIVSSVCVIDAHFRKRQSQER